MDDARLVRLRARPETFYISQGHTVLALGLDGFVSPKTNQGLFVHETRLVSRLAYRIDGLAPQPVALSSVDQHRWLGYYIQLAPGTPERLDQGSGQVPSAAQDALEMRVSRWVGEGLHEEVELTNFGRAPATFRFEVQLDADFADVLEAGGTRRQRGRTRRSWRDSALRFDYESAYRRPGGSIRRIRRGVALHLSLPPDRAATSGPLRYSVSLAPHERWALVMDFIARIEGEDLPLHYGPRSSPMGSGRYDAARRDFLRSSTCFEAPADGTLAPLVSGALAQARRDLAALRLHDRGGPTGWVMSAGLPLFVAVFGRDTLTASWQAGLLAPDMMTGALHELAQSQGTRDDVWRDEEPGRMLHEAHTGPLSALEYVPNGRSYGSVTTSSFYPFVLASLWHWTGDRAAVEPFVEPALAALRWRERHVRTPKGFYAYRTRSRQGVKNQGWKDSGDAIVDHRGADVAPPLATCEEQAFVYAAKQFFSEVLWSLDRAEEASRLRKEARELKAQFNESFWMEDEGFIAMAVDGQDRPVRSLGSNPGHCLASGILDDAHAAAVADRLMAPELFSGWGVRTLSSENPAYNPYSYHRGSVWPVEQGPFALGFMRIGRHDLMETLSRAVFECAGLFEAYRLPEVVSGHPRDDAHPFPALYPGANAPQAWSSSSLFCLVQAMLGLYPYAPLHTLVVDPHLPAWLPELTLRDLRVGDARVDLRFVREEKGTRFEVEERQGSLHVVRQPSPWSLTAGIGERLRDLMTSVV